MDHIHNWATTPFMENAVCFHSVPSIDFYEGPSVKRYIGTLFRCYVPDCSMFLFQPHDPKYATTECWNARDFELENELAAA